MQAHPRTYWKSAMNVFDFIVVLLCVISIPVYFYVPDSDFILTVVLLLRFAAQLLRIVMVYKHHENRSAYMETTRDDLVDFTGYDTQRDIESAQGRQQQQNDHHNSSIISNNQSNIASSIPSTYPASSNTYQQPAYNAIASSINHNEHNNVNFNSQWDV